MVLTYPLCAYSICIYNLHLHDLQSTYMYGHLVSFALDYCQWLNYLVRVPWIFCLWNLGSLHTHSFFTYYYWICYRLKLTSTRKE